MREKREKERERKIEKFIVLLVVFVNFGWFNIYLKWMSKVGFRIIFVIVNNGSVNNIKRTSFNIIFKFSIFFNFLELFKLFIKWGVNIKSLFRRSLASSSNRAKRASAFAGNWSSFGRNRISSFLVRVGKVIQYSKVSDQRRSRVGIGVKNSKFGRAIYFICCITL